MLFKFILSYYKKVPFKISIGFLMLVLVDLAQLFAPRIVQKAIDHVLISQDISELFVYALMIFLLALSIGIFRFFWRITILGTAHFIEYDFKNRLYNHLLTLSSRFFGKTKTGDIMAHMTNDMNAVRMSAAFGVIAGFDATFLFLATIFFMLRMNAKLTMFAIIPLPIISIIALFFTRILFRKFRSVQEAFSLITDKAQELFSGIKIVQAYRQENEESNNFNKISMNYVKMNISLIRLWGTMFPLIFFLAEIGVAIVLFVGGQQVIYNELSAGELVAFISYLGIIVWPMMAVGWVTNIFQRGSASYARIKKFMDEQPDIYDEKNSKAVKLKGSLEFKDIDFSYDETRVLDKLSFKIEQGKYIGICGKIGSGKSTIAKLIMRIIKPESGEMVFDGIPYKQIKIGSIRDIIGYVPQDSFLFSATIEENIRFGNPSASDEEIFKACRIASVHENILEFRSGYKTIVGEKGVTLSGGQKQRVCIARAIIKNPKILILDDALSAVDTNTEKEIVEGIAGVFKDITIIVVSHRISSFMNADNIFVIDNGKVENSGNHKELITSSNIYKNIYELQKLEQ